MILKKGENSQQTIKPSFISGSLIPYLHGHVKIFSSRVSRNSFFRPVYFAKKEFVERSINILIFYWRGKIYIIYV